MSEYQGAAAYCEDPTLVSTMKRVVLRVKASFIHGISHTVFVTSEYCTDSVRTETRSFTDVRTLRHTR